MIMGLRANPKLYRNMGRKCKQEPYFLNGLSRPLSAAQICKKSKLIYRLLATICQHNNKAENKRANHLIEISKSSSSSLSEPADYHVLSTTCRHLYKFAAEQGDSARTDHGSGTHGIAMKNLVYYKLAKIFQLICPNRRVRDGASLLAKRQGHARSRACLISVPSVKRIEIVA